MACKSKAKELAELNGMTLCPDCFLKTVSQMVGET